MRKKFLSFVLAICLIVPCALLLTACGNDDSTDKVMNVGLNPKIEFVIDKNNKVMTVNALNDDGNHIISASINTDTEASAFEGMPADEAVELFLELAEENGYLITGNDEEVKIEISGKADKLMKKVREKANKFFNENGLDIELDIEKLEKEDILKEVEACMKEYSNSELEGMTQEQLIGLLKGSRQETKDLLTQELKDAYYVMRAEKINIAELEELLNVIENLSGTENAILTAFEENMETLMANLDALQTAYNDYFMAEDSQYNIAKRAYIEAKEALLAKRLEFAPDGISEDEKATLASYETAVQEAKTTLDNAKASADLAISTAKSAVATIYNTIKVAVEQIKTILGTLGVNLNDVNNARQQAKSDFKAYFELPENFGNHVGHDKSHWGQPAQA